MKKVICLLLSILFILSCMPMVILADDVVPEELPEQIVEGIGNVTVNDSAMAYASSEKNTLWTPASSLIDGKYSKDTWQGWEVGYPEIIYGADTSAGFSGQYFGVKFLNKEYYEIHDVYINLGLHGAMGGQNAKFTVEFLVEGAWVKVKEFHDSDTQPLAYESYEDAMKNDTSFYHIPSEYSFKLDEPITTNNVRVTISEYGKNYPGGDVLIFPYVYEIVLNGKRGETPELELPEGAYISTNIGYQSFPEASSSASYKYPYCAIDGDKTTNWSPRRKTAGESLTLVLAEAKKINKAVVNFGEFKGGGNDICHSFDIEALVDGEWIKVSENCISLSEEFLASANVGDLIIVEKEFTEVETSALRVVFTADSDKAPSVYEFEAHMSEEKTYYIEDRFDAYQRASASKGNIAVAGTPYANLDFLPYSDINYILDGKTDENAYVWFTGVIDMPAYCGVKLNKKQVIDRVALYFDFPDEEGTDIMSIQIQALIDGEYQTLITTKSYHSELKYEPAFKFDPVETDDIRILYTAGNGTFAHLKELEVYSPNGGLPMFNGLGALKQPPTFLDFTTKDEKAESTSNEAKKELTELETEADEKEFLVETDDNENTEVNTKELPVMAQLTADTEVDSSVMIIALVVGIIFGVALVTSVAFAFIKRRNIR